MTPELQKAMEAASLPFIGGAISEENTRMMSWRYFLEINSLCSLRCPTCTKGNQEGYEHETGIMKRELLNDILDKIKSENPKAMVMLYGNSEPFLHPWLAGAIRAVKERGLSAQMSTNLNYVRKLDDVLEARPDMIIISLSGFTQETYVKGHVGGDIEKVKANMRLIADANGRLIQKDGGGPGVNISVNFHVYNDNQHEVELMREYCKNLGLGFFTSLARAISMENALQYCRSKDPEAVPYEIGKGYAVPNGALRFDDYNKMLPPIGKTYVDAMQRLVIPPDQAREMYKDIPIHEVCPVGAGSMFTFIRHDGLVEMCSCVADRRLVLGDYLKLTSDEMIEKRHGHPICKQCLKYRTNLYFHVALRDKWEPPV